MSETTDLVVIEKADALSVFKDKTRIEEIIQHIEKEARLFVPDLSTVTSRKAIGSMANKVARSKTYIDGVGKDVVAELKELPKQIDEQRRIVRERLDALKDEVRRPLTDWEAEQERIAAEKAAEEERQRIAAEELAAAEALKKQFESDHEIALLLNDKFDRDAAEAKAEAERHRVAREEEIKRQAIEQARQEAEQQQAREHQQHQDALSEISGIQHQIIIARSGRSGVRQGGTIQCIKDTLTETVAWPIDERFGSLIGAAENAKQQAIEQIKQLLSTAETIERQQEELATAEREKQEAGQKEATRLAEEKRIADEAAARAADEVHRKTIGTAVVNALIAHAGLTREDAIATLVALKGDLIPHTTINY
ncbi:hypothetical protein [Erwinia sp. QL-Z3]|uniref:hypothetical protein n=1 Tax=Erwinia sp. QL-Z3 TaxID=2547962 RepID=UPI001070DFA5|nr:hypothetical protein [Erwinia sp. QL-Z3]QBR52756.1 hypothetical protein E2F51_23555 [Erwinia sp. QL-Z3]